MNKQFERQLERCKEDWSNALRWLLVDTLPLIMFVAGALVIESTTIIYWVQSRGHPLLWSDGTEAIAEVGTLINALLLVLTIFWYLPVYACAWWKTRSKGVR